jgi:tetratricopeptide (TPR) repeat protein
VDFRVLGPLEIRDDSGALHRIPAGRSRTLCAALLLSAGTVISADALVRDVWDDAPPAQPRAALQVMVVRLRKALGPDVGSRIRTVPPGYLFAANPGELDLHVAQELCALGRAAHRRADWPETERLLDRALALWRGEPLADVPGGHLAARIAAGLQELRMEAMRQRFDALLALGRHEQILGELTAAVDSWPLHEQFRAQLLVARFRSGRRAEALAGYQDFRRVLVRELGVEPGTELAALHQAVLVGDPSLEWREATTPSEPGLEGKPEREAAPAPESEPESEPEPEYRPEADRAGGSAPPGRQRVSQLPTDVPDFTGRATEVARLLAFVGPDRAPAPGVAVAAIHGMAGVGKTALAVHTAHLLCGRYPDGQFFLDLHAHSPDQEPVRPETALAQLLRAWGTPTDRIPDTVAELSAAWRSAVSGHRVLLVLDDAADASQVRPLLPGDEGSLVLVTSRHRLLLDAAHVVDLDILPPAEAISLFRTVAGERSRAEPEAVAEAVALCGHLPLAIRIAAARLRTRPAWTVAELVRRLADRRRLAELTAGDRGVAAAFAVSYRQLTDAQQRMFRLLGLHPGADFDAEAVAALAGADPPTAEAVLEQLLDANLLQQRAANRYRFHDLMRDHARSLAVEDREDALIRLSDHYRWRASEAIEQVMPHPPGRRPVVSPPSGAAAGSAPFADPEQAEEWLSAEQDNLVAIGVHSATEDWPSWEYAGDLADILWRYQLARGLIHRSLALYEAATRAARRADDPARLARALRGQGRALHVLCRYEQAKDVTLQALHAGEGLGDADTAQTLNNLGSLAWRTGDLKQAADYLRRALELYRSAGDVGAATALQNLGGVCVRLGRYAEAAAYYDQALALHTDLGNRAGQCDALIGLAGVLNRTGDDEKALDHLDRGLAIAADHRLRIAQLGLLETQGAVYTRIGRHREAVDSLRRCLALAQEAGHQLGEAYALTGLGTVHRLAGDLDQALACLEQAESLARRLGDRMVHTDALNALGAVAGALSRPTEARDHHQAALDMARATGDRYEQALAHQGLSRAYGDLGQEGPAREHRARASALFDDLGLPAES